MTITLPAVPERCLLYAGIALYLLICWTIGAVYTRRAGANGRWRYASPPLEMQWFFSPIWVPLFYPLTWVYYFFCWVIYGRQS